jgi:hypothetical protein
MVALLLLLAFDAVVHDEVAPKGGEQIYELVAQYPFHTPTFPFAYRIGVPILVHVLPFSHTLSFSLLAWLSSAAAGATCYTAAELGTGQKVAAVAATAAALAGGGAGVKELAVPDRPAAKINHAKPKPSQPNTQVTVPSPAPAPARPAPQPAHAPPRAQPAPKPAPPPPADPATEFAPTARPAATPTDSPAPSHGSTGSGAAEFGP